MLVGREAECARLDRALESARRGRSSVLVVRGEAGMGKTSLLRHAIERAEAMTVVRATGVESEAELEFSGLLELCRPLLEYVGDLPELQASALRGALGLEPARQHDRFAIGAATLGLLAAAAERQPLLVVVDDVHWLDRPSADALRFAARRLLADKVALIVATRLEEGTEGLIPGADEVTLAPLALAAARSVVENAVGQTIQAEVMDRLHAATHGNPLALVELSEVLTPGQLLGREPLEDPLPTGAGVERAFAGRAARLPVETRRALLLLALAPVDRVEVVARALSVVGLEADALEPAEDERLVEVEAARIRFRHPLVRSAVTRSASPSDRRAAHRALASALDGDEDRRAWHLAAAAMGPDEEAASALAAVGARASGRSGFGPAAAAFERAALLTRDESARVEWLADAGEAAWRAGATERAIVLLDDALGRSGDPRQRARLLHLRGRLEVFTGSHDGAAADAARGRRARRARRPGAGRDAARRRRRALLLRRPRRGRPRGGEARPGARAPGRDVRRCPCRLLARAGARRCRPQRGGGRALRPAARNPGGRGGPRGQPALGARPPLDRARHARPADRRVHRRQGRGHSLTRGRADRARQCARPGELERRPRRTVAPGRLGGDRGARARARACSDDPRRRLSL